MARPYMTSEPEGRPTDPGYERPPLWRRTVGPGRLTFAAYVTGFMLVMAGLTGAGASDLVVFFPYLAAAFLTQGAADLWWRRNGLQSADRQRRRLSSPRNA